MSDFKGFTDSETFTQVPDSFFRLLMKEIKDIDELKVTLYAIWWIGHLEGPFRAISETDFNARELRLSANKIRSGLEKAVERGSMLRVQNARLATEGSGRNDPRVYFLLNTPRGRAALQAIESGKWNPEATGTALPVEHPNVFKLYEENMGPLTPLIADALKDAEETYSPEWIAEAVELAVKNNKRSWRYCEAILKRWKEEGRAEKQDRRDSEKDRRKYIEGEFADYIEH